MSRYEGGMIGSVVNTPSGSAYTGRANGIFILPIQIVNKSSSLWAIGQTIPNAPIIGTASSTGTGTSISVAFIPPVQDGGSTITSYTVTSSPGGITGVGVGSPVVVSGLTPFTTYTFTVTATNALGTSISSGTSNSLTPAITDPYMSSVSLLINGDTLSDSSANRTTITNNGSVTTNTTTKKFGTGSIYFNGSNYLTVPEITLDADFTIEFWIYRSTEDFQIILSGSNDTQIDIGVSIGAVAAYVFQGTTASLSGTTNKVGINVWKHIAITRSGNTAYIFIDGLLDVSGTFSSSSLVKISNISKYGVGSGYYLNGYIDELRITKGVARYTNNFILQTTPFPTYQTVPDAPTIGSATTTGTGTSISVTFTIPGNDGSSPITNYTATSSPGGITGTGASSPIIVTGLTPSTLYTFTVTATNALGTSISSGASNSVRPDPNSLLLKGDGVDGSTTFTDSSSNNTQFTAYGNARIVTNQKKYGTGSMYFDGTGDYIAYNSSSTVLQFGTSDYTVEFWMNISVAPGDYSVVSCGPNGFNVRLVSGLIRVDALGSAVTSSCSFSPNTNQWYHVAICRGSGTVRYFIDGVLTSSSSDSRDWTINTHLQVGGLGLDYNGYFFNGYLDDLRVTKGLARYTSTFTPPSSGL